MPMSYPYSRRRAKAAPGSYRPVSLTSVYCKLIETVLRDVLMSDGTSGEDESAQPVPAWVVGT